MAGITLAQAEAQLTLWIAASTAVASNQSYTIGGRSLSRVNAEHIDRMITYWNNHVNRLSQSASGRGRTRYVVNE